MNFRGVTSYKWPASLYLDRLHHNASRLIVKHDYLESRILDFGCGHKRFSQLNPTLDVTGYDINAALSDIKDWRTGNFDLIFANQVFYTFKSEELEALLSEFVERYDNAPLLVGISRQGFLNRLGMQLLRYNNAHANTSLRPSEELSILLKFYKLVDAAGVACLADMYLLKPQRRSKKYLGLQKGCSRGQLPAIMSIPRGRLYHSLLSSSVNVVRSFFSALDDAHVVRAYEARFSEYTCSSECVAFPLARTAIYFILSYLSLPPNSYILMPPITIKGILEVVLDLGLVPVYVDSDPDTLCFNKSALQKALEQYSLKAAIITPLFGIVPKMDELSKLLDLYGVYKIVDFSQALNASFSGMLISSYGDASVYSSSSIKTLDTLGGGLAVTNDTRLGDYLRKCQSELARPDRRWLVKKSIVNLIRSLSVSNPFFTFFTYPYIRYLVRQSPGKALRQTGERSKELTPGLPDFWFTSFTSLQAQIGLDKLKYVAIEDNKRIRIADCYSRVLEGSSARLIKVAGQASTYWQYAIKTSSALYANGFMARHKIDTATTSLSFLPFIGEVSGNYSCKSAETIHKNYLFIPCHPSMTDTEVTRILKALADYRYIAEDV